MYGWIDSASSRTLPSVPPTTPADTDAAGPACGAALTGFRSCLLTAASTVPESDKEAAVARCLAVARGVLGSSCLASALDVARERRERRRKGGGGDDAPDDEPPTACRAAIEAASGTAAGMEALLASGRVALTLAVAMQVFQEFNATGDPAVLGYLFLGHDVSLGSPDNCKGACVKLGGGTRLF